MTQRLQIILGAVLSQLLVLLALLFLASGISQLFAEWFQRTPQRAGTEGRQEVPFPLLAADGILERNPSDARVRMLEGAEALGERTYLNPLDAPACEHVIITIVSDYDDDRYSFATLQSVHGSAPQVARIGDITGDWTMVSIAQHPRTLSPTVWFLGEDLCQASLFEPPSSRLIQASPVTAAAKTKKPSAPSTKTQGFAAHVKQLSATEFQVDRAAAEEVLADPSRFMSGVQAFPQTRGGHAGIFLQRLSASSPLAALGLKRGDFLTSLNGSALADPEKMLAAYARLRTAERLQLEVLRAGALVTVDVQIQ